MSREERRIIHVDLDHFFTQIEQRDDPGLKGKPVAVGGKVPRGVISTASYEARKYGVGSALATAIALKRCPQLVLLPGRMSYYREVSRHIFDIFRRYTPLVEQLSVDEGFLDVTTPLLGPASGTIIARMIKRDIWRELRLTASAGVSYCKFIAKVASGRQKPDGLTVVTPQEATAFLASLPIEEFYGVGPVTAEKLRLMGVRTGLDLSHTDPRRLEQVLGKHGTELHLLAQGIDERPVDPHRERKSVSSETTFDVDVFMVGELKGEIAPLAEDVSARLKKNGMVASGVVVKVKYADHTQFSRQMVLPWPVQSATLIARAAERILSTRIALRQPVRLLGVGAYDLRELKDMPVQPFLFPELMQEAFQVDWLDGDDLAAFSVDPAFAPLRPPQ
jgi:DNA polymerase-4